MDDLKDKLALMAEDLAEALESLRKEDLNCLYCQHAQPDKPCDAVGYGGWNPVVAKRRSASHGK